MQGRIPAGHPPINRRLLGCLPLLAAALVWSGTARAACDIDDCGAAKLQQVWAKITGNPAPQPAAQATATAQAASVRSKARRVSQMRPRRNGPAKTSPVRRDPSTRHHQPAGIAAAPPLPPPRPATFAERFTDGTVQVVAPEAANAIDLAADAYDAVAGAQASLADFVAAPDGRHRDRMPAGR